MATVIDATYGVTTPMFCRGADPALAEPRAPSFKGVLRFWWRALAWSRLNGNLERIRCEEDDLFGSAAVGQARVSIVLATTEQPTMLSARQVLKDGRSEVGEGARYLGYGLMAAFNNRKRGTLAGQLTRACLRAPFELTVRVRARCLTDDQMQCLHDALIAVGLFGGMGARSRKGYGSLSIRTLCTAGNQRQVSRSLDDFLTTIRRLTHAESPTGLPTFTAMSSNARYFLVRGRAERPLQLLDLIGQEIKQAIRAVPPRERTGFGLPRKPRTERRASPLFIHIDECAGAPIAVLSLLPAWFLPDGKSDIYGPVHKFLDRLVNQKEPLQVNEVQP